MSHGMNVPSDHFCSRYYRRCNICGRTYHMEDGGCDCTADLEPCACGECLWETDAEGVVYCTACETEPGAVREPDDDDDDDDETEANDGNDRRTA
jgi:hypothetical protein